MCILTNRIDFFNIYLKSRSTRYILFSSILPWKSSIYVNWISLAWIRIRVVIEYLSWCVPIKAHIVSLIHARSKRRAWVTYCSIYSVCTVEVWYANRKTLINLANWSLSKKIYLTNFWGASKVRKWGIVNDWNIRKTKFASNKSGSVAWILNDVDVTFNRNDWRVTTFCFWIYCCDVYTLLACFCRLNVWIDS